MNKHDAISLWNATIKNKLNWTNENHASSPNIKHLKKYKFQNIVSILVPVFSSIFIYLPLKKRKHRKKLERNKTYIKQQQQQQQKKNKAPISWIPTGDLSITNLKSRWKDNDQKPI